MVKVDVSKCVGCGSCIPDCQPGNIILQDGKCYFKPEARCLECGHCAAVCPQNALVLEGYDPADFVPYDPKTFDIDPDRLLNFVRFRRSTRQFKKDQVPDEMIEKIIEMGRYTQTGANMQMLRYVVVGGETMDKVKKIANETLANYDMESLDMSQIRLPVLYAKFQALWKAWYQMYLNGKEMLLHDAPHHLLVVTYKTAEIDAAINIGHMELMINALGLGACCTGFGTLAYALSPELRQLVGVGDEETVAFSMTFGYPDVEYKRTVPRKKANYTKV